MRWALKKLGGAIGDRFGAAKLSRLETPSAGPPPSADGEAKPGADGHRPAPMDLARAYGLAREDEHVG